MSERHSDGPGGVDGGSGDSDTDHVDHGECETDEESAELGEDALVGLVGRSEDDEDEDEGQDDLSEDSDPCLAGSLDEVGSEVHVPDGFEGEVGHSHGEADDEGTGDDCTDDLEDDVEGELLGVDLFVEEHCEGDRGVEVASGDLSDGHGHDHDGKAECEGGGDEVPTGEHSGSYSEEDQYEGTDQLGDCCFDCCIHSINPS